MECTYTTIVGEHNRVTIKDKIAKSQGIRPGVAVEITVHIIGPITKEVEEK